MKLAFGVLWQSFIAAPTLLGVLLILSTSVIATEIQPPNPEVNPATQTEEASKDITNSEDTAVEPTSDLPLSINVANPLESAPSSVISIDPVVQSENRDAIESTFSSNDVTISDVLRSNREASLNQVTSISQLSDVQPIGHFRLCNLWWSGMAVLQGILMAPIGGRVR